MALRNIIMIVFSFQVIYNMTRPVVSLYASSLGASTFDIGLLTGAFAFAPLMLAIHAGRVTDKFGDRLPVLLGNIGIAIGMALPWLFPTMWALFASQIIVGICNIFISVSLQNVIGHAAPEGKRDHYYGLFGTAVAVGGVVGPILGGYIVQHFSYAAAFFASVLLGIVPILFSLIIRNERRSNPKAGSEFTASFTLLKMPILRKALLSSALVLYSRDIFVAYFPLYADSIGISVSTIGWILSSQSLAMVVIRAALSKLTESLGRDRVLLASIVAAGLAFVLVPFTSHPVLLGIWAALMGFGLGCGQPLSMATAYNVSPKERTGEVLGLRLAFNCLSQLLAPLFFGVIGSMLGLLSVFFLSGAFLFSGSWAISSKKSATAVQSFETTSLHK
ncbi:MFS transporter [Paenibacillus cremeus]|uniref:MFS transporter n=1 Tax=Paenibacillus cremeus TaxID=2163881 RepID=A0A559K8B1_9BACL|nr:MFS transporter [Paenibacillus cremeus]TVY08375.1 MFS transporter [Paenibacillus cremeus]